MNGVKNSEETLACNLRQAWESAAEALEDDPMRPVRYAKAFRYLQEIASGSSLLEIGCGQGTGLVFAKYLGFKQLVGVEVSGERLKRARAKHGSEVVLNKVGIDSRWDFADNQFDVCISCAVIEHTTDQIAFIKEIARVVRPGGYIVISSDCWQWRILQALGIYRSIQPIDSAPFPTRLLSAFRENNLHLLHFEGFPLPGQEFRFVRTIYNYMTNKPMLSILRRVAWRMKKLISMISLNAKNTSATSINQMQVFEEIMQSPLLPYRNLPAAIRLIFSDENVFFLRKNDVDIQKSR